MTQNLFLYGFSLPMPVWYLLGLTPLLCVIIGWVLKVKFRKPHTVGFAYNGNRWVKWLLLLYVLVMVINNFVLPHIFDGRFALKSSNNPNGILYIMLFTAYCFVCYFLVAFREVNEEQAVHAKSSEKLVLDFAATAAGAAAGASVGLWQILLSALQLIWQLLNPINIINVSGNVVTYTFAGAGQAFANLTILIPVFVILVMLGVFVQMVMFFLTAFVMWLMTVLKFLLNLRITIMGPTAVRF